MDYEQYVTRCNAVGKAPTSLARSCGVQSGTITRWKRGECLPSYSSILKLENALAELETPNEIPLKPLVDNGNLVMRTDRNLIREITQKVIVPEKITYFAPDNAMLLEGIPQGAVLTLFSRQPQDGNIVLVALNGDYLLRRFCRYGEVVLLTASNPKYSPIATNTSELSEDGNGIIGIVTHVSFDVK